MDGWVDDDLAFVAPWGFSLGEITTPVAIWQGSLDSVVADAKKYGKGGPPYNGVVLGQYQTRVLDMASAYATLANSGVYHRPHLVQKVVNSDGQVLFDASQQELDPKKRADQYARMQDLYRSGPTLALYESPYPVVLKKSVHGFLQIPLGNNIFSKAWLGK